MKHIKKSVITTLTVLCLPTLAHAEWKGYAGAGCASTISSPDIIRGDDGATNRGTQARRVICPIVRDQKVGGTNKIKRVRVRFMDNNAKRDGWCRLYSKTAEGDVYDFAQRQTTGVGLNVLTFENLDTPSIGHIVLQCEIPARDGLDRSNKSSIISYAVHED